MSLSRLALRIVTARALHGATLAGTRVFDSAVDPIDMQVQSMRQPFIVVYTDDHERDVDGRELRTGSDVCQLVIEAAVASRVSAPGQDDEVIEVPHTDANMELLIDLIGFQIMRTLTAGTSEWARLWKSFAINCTKVVSRRAASAENGVRFAARQLTITCNLISDPEQTGPAYGLWVPLLAAMEADPEMTGAAAILRHAIEGDGAMSDWALAAASLGLSDETVAALGLTPELDEAGNPVGLSAVVVSTGRALDEGPDGWASETAVSTGGGIAPPEGEEPWVFEGDF